jgi:acetyl-CoA carboxylase, biotin carboxylase subunit
MTQLTEARPERKPATGANGSMFKKILIANRGEIALRVICAAKELGIKTVAVYSEPDRNSLHVRFADEAVCIGPARATESYLHIPAIISAAEIASAEAIHPGYGLLSENANFAHVCETTGIKFIGPRSEVIRAMGEKDRARATMKKSGVPILPGSDGVMKDVDEALGWAKKVGYPVIVKAVAGGGGRGMRIIRTPEEMPNQFHSASSEAAGAFGNGDLYMEKFVERPRHIEFQMLCDEHGNALCLGERDCSVQRRNQKLIEESPSPGLTPELRKKMMGLLEKTFKEVGYWNAGTVEFLFDSDTGNLTFMEVNTRIQVEHPVTEFVTDVDLVKAQIQIAAGAKLPDIVKLPIEAKGHSIECRINAEHPEKFTPSAGRITVFNPPGGNGVRVDSVQYQDGYVSPHYDSMIAKLIVRGHDRAEAIAKMNRALDMFVVEGIHTSIPLHKKILAEPDFISGNFTTKFMERFMPKK